MGLSSRFAIHARHRDGPHRGDDQGKAPAKQRRGTGRLAAGLIAAGLGFAAQADTLRVATFNTELSRDGPGLLLRDLLSSENDDIASAVALIVRVSPDVIVLTSFDHDHDGHALEALTDRLRASGATYSDAFSALPNTGIPTGRDLDGDGRFGGPRDAQGYGRFAGQGGMAILSRHPVDPGRARDFSTFLWSDLPGTLARPEDHPDIQRLSTTAHWDVPITLPSGTAVHILAWHATPPVFDGPEDRNGRRNHDEAAFWLRYLEGALDEPLPDAPFVIAGDANLDPVDGDGRSTALRSLLVHPLLRDPAPQSAAAAAMSRAEGGVNTDHRGDPALDTANWSDAPGGPGNLRVDYVRPSRHWRVTDAGVTWPAASDPQGEGVRTGSRHGLVWVDLVLE